MILVDTSVWISFFSRQPGPRAARLRDRIERGVVVCTAPPILQEVLQGTTSEEHFEAMRRRLRAIHVLHPRNEDETFVAAARIYAQCRWKGITPRSATDCLIAQIAIEHDVSLYCDDEDFRRIAQVVPALSLL